MPKMLGLALLLALFCAAAYHLDFVGEKIREYRQKIAYRERGWERTRFGGIIFDLEYIERRPFFGWGPNHTTRYMLHGGENIGAMGNGLSDFTAKFGLLGLITVLTSIWIGVYKLERHNLTKATLFIFFIVMVLNGEHLLDYSVYLGLMFLEPMPKNRHSILGFESSAIT